ncbi:defense response [Spatholobus suberectus]|nr:defense response [Spatholobus suberectus]
MAKQVYLSILFIILFFAVCVQICQTQGFDDGKCNKLNLQCICYKICKSDVDMDGQEAQVKTFPPWNDAKH